MRIGTNSSESCLQPIRVALKPLLASARDLVALDLRPEIFANLCEDLAPRVHHREVSLDDLRGWARALRSTSSSTEPISASGGPPAILVCGLSLALSEPFDLAQLVPRRQTFNGAVFVVLEVGTIDLLKVERRLGYLLEVFWRCGVRASPPRLVRLANKRYYAVLQLELADHADRWTLDNLSDIGFSEFQQLFVDAFAQEYDQRLWNWKYASGRGRAVSARRAGRLVAYYGSTERRIRFFGAPGVGLQICDVMVAPKERGVMTKRGAMFLTAAAYLETYLGVQGLTLAYGFPTKRHMQLGARLGLYAEVARMTELRWADLTSCGHERAVRIRAHQANDSLAWLGDAWKKMAKSMKDNICTTRDLEYLRYRYFEHPTRDYQLYRVSTRFTRRIIGGIVLQASDDALELVDIIGPRKHFKRLVVAAKLVAAATPCRTLYCWITDTFSDEFADAACVATDLGLSVPTNVWVHGPDPLRLQGKWFLMSGDTEFR